MDMVGLTVVWSVHAATSMDNVSRPTRYLATSWSTKLEVHVHHFVGETKSCSYACGPYLAAFQGTVRGEWELQNSKAVFGRGSENRPQELGHRSVPTSVLSRNFLPYEAHYNTSSFLRA